MIDGLAFSAGFWIPLNVFPVVDFFRVIYGFLVTALLTYYVYALVTFFYLDFIIYFSFSLGMRNEPCELLPIDSEYFFLKIDA